MISRLSQPAEFPRTSPQTIPKPAAADQRQAGNVETGVAAVALLDLPEHERDRGQADRNVEPEDPRPVDALGDRAADQRAERDRDPGDRAEQADRRSALLGREGGGQQRQPQRQHQSRAGPLGCPGRDEEADAGRQRGRRRGRGEQAQPDRVEGPAPVAVAERGGGDEQAPRSSGCRRSPSIRGPRARRPDRGGSCSATSTPPACPGPPSASRSRSARRPMPSPSSWASVWIPGSSRSSLFSVRRRNCRFMNRDPARGENPLLGSEKGE